MKEQELKQVVHQDPFRPFKLVTNDGEEITVTEPRKAHVSGQHVALHGISRRKDRVGKKGFRILSAKHILSAVMIDGQ